MTQTVLHQKEAEWEAHHLSLGLYSVEVVAVVEFLYSTHLATYPLY